MNNAQLTYLEWDSEQLGIPCYEADCTVDTVLLRTTEGLTVIRVPAVETGPLNQLVRSGANVIATEILAEWKHEWGAPKRILPPGCSVKIGPSCLLEFIEFIHCFNGTRFFLDHRIPQHLSRRLWATSFKNQCGADDCIKWISAVLFVANEPAGIWNFRIKDDYYVTPFVGIRDKFKNQRLAVPFMVAVIQELKPLLIRNEFFSSNINSCIAHLNAGFKVVGAQHILHYIDKKTLKNFKTIKDGH